MGRALRAPGRGGGAEDATTLEQDFEDQAQVIEAELVESMAEINARLDAEAEADFYTCLVFQSRAQRDAFLQRLGYNPEREDVSFLDGEELARRMGVAVPAGPEWKESKVKELFAPFALKPGERRRR